MWYTRTNARRIRRLLDRPNARWVRSDRSALVISGIGGEGLLPFDLDASEVIRSLVGPATAVRSIAKRTTADGEVRYDLKTATVWRRVALLFRDDVLVQVVVKGESGGVVDVSYGRQHIVLPMPGETLWERMWQPAENYLRARRTLPFAAWDLKNSAHGAIRRHPDIDPG